MPGGEVGLGKSFELERALPVILCGLICQSLAKLCTKRADWGQGPWGGSEAEGRKDCGKGTRGQF